MSEKNKNKEKLAEVVNIKKAKKKIVPKKISVQELCEKISSDGKILYFSKKPRKAICLYCGEDTLIVDKGGWYCLKCDRHYSYVCVCKPCHGPVVKIEKTYICLYCEVQFNEDELFKK